MNGQLNKKITLLLRVGCYISMVALMACSAYLVKTGHSEDGLLTKIFLARYRDRVERFATHSGAAGLVVAKGQDVVLQWPQEHAQELVDIMGVTKSVLSLLLGVVEKNYAGNVLQMSLADVFPQLRGTREGTEVLVSHLLDQTSCLDTAFAQDLYSVPDLVTYALSAKLICEPGSRQLYNNRAINLLPAIIARITKMPADEFAQMTFFAPLGIKEYHWQKDSTGNVYGFSGLKLKAADLAKIGMLVLAKGQVGQQQLLHSAWVENILQSRIPAKKSPRLWGRRRVDVGGFAMNPDVRADLREASGYGGQFLEILPHYGIVGVYQRKIADDFLADDGDVYRIFGYFLCFLESFALIKEQPFCYRGHFEDLVLPEII